MIMEIDMNEMWYMACRARDEARTASAAWKAKTKQLKELYADRCSDLDFEYNRAEAAEERAELAERTLLALEPVVNLLEQRNDAEKRVAELEEVATLALVELDRIGSDIGFEPERYQERINALDKLSRALNK